MQHHWFAKNPSGDPLEYRARADPEHRALHEHHVKPAEARNLKDPDGKDDEVPVDPPGDPSRKAPLGPEAPDVVVKPGGRRTEHRPFDPVFTALFSREHAKREGRLQVRRLRGEEGHPDGAVSDGTATRSPVVSVCQPPHRPTVLGQTQSRQPAGARRVAAPT